MGKIDLKYKELKKLVDTGMIEFLDKRKLTIETLSRVEKLCPSYSGEGFISEVVGGMISVRKI